MRSTPTHKDSLLKHGMRRFYATGYHGTSVDTVLEEAGVPKGSFYHHFGSKEGFAMAVVHEYHKNSAARLRKWSGNLDITAPERLRGYMEELAQALAHRGNRQGCLVGKFTLELAPASDQFSALLGTMLSSWKSSVQAVIAEGQSSGTVRSDISSSDLASLVLSSIQGAVLLGLAHRSSEPMHIAAATVPKLIAFQASPP